MTEKPPLDVTDHIADLRRYARRLTRHGADSEDLVHDTLVRAFERARRRPPESNTRSWLFSILRNLFIDQLRARRAVQAREQAASALVVREVSGEQESYLRMAELRAGFLGLPEDQRAVLWLIAVDGLSCREAAARLGVPMGTAMSRLARARAALRVLDEDRADNKAGGQVIALADRARTGR